VVRGWFSVAEDGFSDGDLLYVGEGTRQLSCASERRVRLDGLRFVVVVSVKSLCRGNS
jgi:hypothetical protein